MTENIALYGTKVWRYTVTAADPGTSLTLGGPLGGVHDQYFAVLPVETVGEPKTASYLLALGCSEMPVSVWPTMIWYVTDDEGEKVESSRQKIGMPIWIGGSGDYNLYRIEHTETVPSDAEFWRLRLDLYAHDPNATSPFYPLGYSSAATFVQSQEQPEGAGALRVHVSVTSDPMSDPEALVIENEDYPVPDDPERLFITPPGDVNFWVEDLDHMVSYGWIGGFGDTQINRIVHPVDPDGWRYEITDDAGTPSMVLDVYNAPEILNPYQPGDPLPGGVHVMIEGTYVPENGKSTVGEPYLDGDQPGARWEGQPNQSTSVWGTDETPAVPLEQAPTISLATLVLSTEMAAATALNEGLDTNPDLMNPFTDWLDRVHAENHTTSGAYNIWAGAKNMGTSDTTLGEKMTAAGLKTSVYGHGSYVMQARLEEASDLEWNYPLGIAVFFPGNPDEERLPEMLTVDPEVDRDEVGFEAGTMNFWNARSPVGATAQLVSSPVRNGVQSLAVTMGSTPGQLLASTGLTTGIVKPCFQGMKIETGVYSRAVTTGRTLQAEIRWMNAAFGTVATTAGSTNIDNNSSWSLVNVTDVAPAGAVCWALQVRWLGPPANGEIHVLDDAYSKDFAGRLVAALTNSQTSVQIRSAQRLKPADSIAAVDVTTNNLTHNAHGLAADTSLYMVGTNLPAPLVENTLYYVRNPAPNTFMVAATPGGTPIDLTTAGAQSKYSKAPNNWPFRAPRVGDSTVAVDFTSESSHRCVHWIRVDDEIMGISAVAGPVNGVVTLTVVRGMWQTAAVAHSADAKVYSPVYVGSISEGADATFAGSPQVDDAAKALRYSLALEQGLDLPQPKRATEWLTKRRIMEILEFDWGFNPAEVPNYTTPGAVPPDGWSGYADAGEDNRSVNSMYLDITGTSFYNMADSWGYDVTPWSIVGVDGATPPLPPDSLNTPSALGAAQISKIADFRTFMTSVGLPAPQYMIGNNLAWQSNFQDPEKQKIIESGVLDLGNLEFWINNPLLTEKYNAQRTQWMLCCKEDRKVCAWAKTGQSGIANSPFDTGTVGTVEPADIAHYRRWCYAHFLMGWRGSDNQQFATEWGINFLTAMEPEFTYNLGLPQATYDEWEDLPEWDISTPGIKHRTYERGLVVLNTTGSPYTFVMDNPMRDLSTEDLDQVVSKVIPAYDAAFFHLL